MVLASSNGNAIHLPSTGKAQNTARIIVAGDLTIVAAVPNRHCCIAVILIAAHNAAGITGAIGLCIGHIGLIGAIFNNRASLGI